MIQSLDPSAQQFLVSLTRIQSAIKRASDQITSGLKVSTPSDAPDQISDILQLYVDLGRNAQIQTNLGRIESEVGTAQAILERAIKIVDSVRALGVQGAGTMQTAEARQILAGDVQSQMELLVSASCTIVAGRYVFSGDRDQDPPYELNLLNGNGVNRLVTAPSTRLIQHASGGTFAAGKTAGEVFDARNPDDSFAPDNVFAAVNGLRTALETNDQAGIDAALTALRAAGDHLNVELAFYGTAQNNVDEAIDFSGKLDVRLKAELSNRRDADVTAAIMELEQAKNQQEVALSARAQLPRTSLFDFLR